MEDIFHNLLVSTDPHISNIKKVCQNKRKKYPPDVVQFFDISNTDEYVNEEKESDSE